MTAKGSVYTLSGFNKGSGDRRCWCDERKRVYTLRRDMLQGTVIIREPGIFFIWLTRSYAGSPISTRIYMRATHLYIQRPWHERRGASLVRTNPHGHSQAVCSALDWDRGVTLPWSCVFAPGQKNEELSIADTFRLLFASVAAAQKTPRREREEVSMVDTGVLGSPDNEQRHDEAAPDI